MYIYVHGCFFICTLDVHCVFMLFYDVFLTLQTQNLKPMNRFVLFFMFVFFLFDNINGKQIVAVPYARNQAPFSDESEIRHAPMPPMVISQDENVFELVNLPCGGLVNVKFFDAYGNCVYEVTQSKQNLPMTIVVPIEIIGILCTVNIEVNGIEYVANLMID